MRLTLLCEIPVARLISLGLILVPGLSFWLQINCSTCVMLSAMLAELFRPPPYVIRLDRPAALIFLNQTIIRNIINIMAPLTAVDRGLVRILRTETRCNAY